MGAHHGPDHPHRHPPEGAALRVGIAGPVGSGKTELVACLCRALSDLDVVVVTNDIFTREDAEILHRRAVLEPERIVAVQTGCCPHTAIRDDISENVEVVEELERRFSPDVVLVESGGDNLTACFSRALVDVQIFVIDVAGGDKVPRKGGPGIETSDLLVINKSDLAPHVGADLEVMAADAAAKRGQLPFVITSLRDQPDAAAVAAFIRSRLRSWPADAHEYEHDDHEHRDHDGAGSLAR
ncbi:urease accessory protein UreG [Desertimonas flava]|uniref:urease accessory protein UreG n=1 Tax=Desertimonas flava TaxID=2064846 RepID=UPI000E356F72|nr:urease accessory protein UreG [Desertimonas flava]